MIGSTAAGEFQQQARVYGRAGQPCGRCGATLRRIVLAQRSTYLCPGCQRRGCAKLHEAGGRQWFRGTPARRTLG